MRHGGFLGKNDHKKCNLVQPSAKQGAKVLIRPADKFRNNKDLDVY